MEQIKRPQSLTELVTEQLRKSIVEGEFEPGAPLSEAMIAKRLQVSRTPVREAFARLELEGLLTSAPQRGTFVFSVDRKSLTDICEVRTSLEVTALRLAVERDAAGLTKALTGVVERMTNARESGDDKTYLTLDTEFHQTILDRADNPFLDDAYQTIAAKMATLRTRLGGHPHHMEKSYREHIAIRDLVREEKTDEAIELLVAHIGRKEGSYWNL